MFQQESKYGAHIFHTEHERVWEYLQAFSNWTVYEHKVKGYVHDEKGKLKLVPIPPNQVRTYIICNNEHKVAIIKSN
jgi:UDP-galactopyranose mutase